MLNNLRVKNFKRLRDVSIELGNTVIFIGPNNSGKTTALQALALWEIGLRKWSEKPVNGASGNRSGVTINRRDLIAVPVPVANLLWKDLNLLGEDAGKITIDIAVSGVTGGMNWECAFEFDYANEESFYCNLSPGTPIPGAAAGVRVAFLPPMSGMVATEDRLQEGAINVRIGEGRTAEVLRNLCFQIHENDRPGWHALVSRIESLFGVTLQPPEYLKERGQITMSYKEGGIELDLVSSGRGLQQTLLLLAHLYTHPGSVLLLDEPDAHLEILRQRQIYQILTATAEAQRCQVIAASHSEVLLNEAADRDVVVAFIGKPHRIDDRGNQLLKSLRSIGFDQYYQAEQKGWVLYLEGSTDLAILKAFAHVLQHRAAQHLEQPFVHYVANQPPKAREHFFGLREAKPDLVGIAVFDSISWDLNQTGALCELKWSRREIENYLCYPETLLAFAEQIEADAGPLFESPLRDRQKRAMRDAIAKVAAALKLLRPGDPFGPDVKASEDFLTPVFRSYFDDLGLPNLMQKTDFHSLVKFVPVDLIDPEISAKLDRISEVAETAAPLYW